MKKFSEFIDKLTLKQAQKYSLLSAIVFTLLCFITITLILHSLMDPIIILLTLALALLVGVAFWYLSCTLLFDVDLKKAKQRVITKYSLTKDSYTELNYIQEDFEHTSSNPKMLAKIVDNYNCKFYAKLTNDEKIELIVKDKDENIIYTEILHNFIYFENHFEIK